MPAFAPERLLLIEVAAEGAALTALSGSALHATVRNAVLEQFGDFGAGCVLNSLQGVCARRRLGTIPLGAPDAARAAWQCATSRPRRGRSCSACRARTWPCCAQRSLGERVHVRLRNREFGRGSRVQHRLG